MLVLMGRVMESENFQLARAGSRLVITKGRGQAGVHSLFGSGERCLVVVRLRLLRLDRRDEGEIRLIMKSVFHPHCLDRKNVRDARGRIVQNSKN